MSAKTRDRWRLKAREQGLKRQREHARFERAIQFFPDIREQLYDARGAGLYANEARRTPLQSPPTPETGKD